MAEFRTWEELRREAGLRGRELHHRARRPGGAGGVNGAGKSTLIKILAGAEPFTSGEYTLGHNAQPDYFAQDQYKELDMNARLIDDLGEVAPRATNTELRSILG